MKKIEFKTGDVVEILDIDGKQKKIVFAQEWEDFTIDYLVKKGRKIIKIERPVAYETIYETPKQILNKEEKEYLEAVIRPFKERVRNIIKYKMFDSERISISFYRLEDCYGFTDLPEFDEGTMYKGMELDKEYTLKELGLFEE